MRLIAIPIARARLGASPVSTFLAQRTPIKPSFTPHQHKAVDSASAKAASVKATKTASDVVDTAKETDVSAADVTEGNPTEKPPIMKRVLDRASKFWIDLGREDQTSTFDWKRKTYTTGEKLMDRIEYEEWALKGVDPALGPRLTAPADAPPKANGEASTDEKATPGSSSALHSSAHADNVPLLYPPSLLSPTSLLSSLTHLTAARQPHHRQRLIWCIAGMPLTIPFIVVPVVPNLPFFYLLWRAYSHWRAGQSSKYLSDLIKQKRLVPTPSEELDRIFALPVPVAEAKPKPVERSATAQGEAGKDSAAEKKAADDVEYESLLILKPFHVKTLSETFNMDRQLAVDLRRARQQTIKSIKAGEMAKLERAMQFDENLAAKTDKQG